MQNIYQYILEKLKINKDSKLPLKNEFNKGDKFICIAIDLTDINKFDEKSILLRVYEPFTVISLENNILKYEVSKNILEKKVFLNSNGFYEHQSGYKSTTAVFLPKYYAEEFINNVYKKEESLQLNKEKIFNYFDSNDDFLNKYDNILKKTNSDEIERILKELND